MKQTQPICDGWQIQGFPFEGFSPERLPADGWLEAAVPGDVHTALMAHGVISDPAVGTGDAACAWVEEQVWVYRRRLDITPEMAAAERLCLRFEGLDTLCDVYLDGVKLGEFQNMFVEHILPLRGVAGEGKHALMLVFWPVCRCSRRDELPEGFWINYSLERAFVRKAAYMFGWDWTPRVVTCGIWRPVCLEWGTGPEMGRLQARTLSAGGEEAQIAVSCPVTGKGRVRVSLWEGERIVAQAWLEGRETQIRVNHPRLWWTHDQGEPYLYTLRAVMCGMDGTEQKTQSLRFGIRTVEMQTAAADGSPRYVTLLNGRPVFLRGANWVPMSNRPATCTAAKYEAYLSLARDAGMNALSLWGGGIYEDEAFYRLCDEKGILCWQYFMFACGEYPDWDEAFLRNVRDEVEKVTDRLRSHCCIALWIGNVESEMLCHKIHLRRPMYGERLFESLLPEWMRELAPGAYYMPSSPWGGETPNSMVEGDRHNWDVWFNDVPYTDYQRDSTTFCSEFGLHAAPVRESIWAFTGEDQLHKDSFLFRYLNRDQDLSRMNFYFDAVTGQPGSLEEYIRYSMLIQAEGLACGVEHFRRRFPQCGGSLIWQLNDCCLCHSWSLIDALGTPKAAYYEAKRFFSPVLVSLTEEEGVTRVWVTNHSPAVFEDDIFVEVGDFLGRRALEERIPVCVKPGESQCVFDFRLGGRFAPNVVIANRRRLYYAAAWASGQERFARHFYERQKNLLLPPTHLEVTCQDGNWIVHSDVYARQVAIEGDVNGLEFSDNWFDLRPGQCRAISVRVRHGAPLSRRRLSLSALNAPPTPLEADSSLEGS